MPELPDIALYLHALAPRVLGVALDRVRVASPFLVRSIDPPLEAFSGSPVRSLERLGKRIVFGFDAERFLVLHLMIAGRLRWREPKAPVPAKVGLAAFDFPSGTLVLTEAGSKRRASLTAVQGASALGALDPGGIDVLDASPAGFAAALRRERHTLKRALTDPHLFSGIGNAYSDEILHAARLSPLRMTDRLSDHEVARLHEACQATLSAWTAKLVAEAGDAFPEKVTAFREGMAVHGRFGRPCPVCGTPVQRLAYAANEANYCPACQTEGRLLADRALSRLLREDWPRSLDELEAFKAARREPR